MYHDYITIVCTYCGHEFKVPVYCGNRFCSVCSYPRTNRVRQKIQFLLTKVKQTKTCRVRMVTLTIENQRHLSPMVKKLVASFRRLRQTEWWKHQVYGGAFVIEVTGSKGSWHAHLHVLVQAEWVRWEFLHRLWKVCSGGNGAYVSKIPKWEAVRYLTKYLTKDSNGDVPSDEVADCLKSYRLYQSFGSWLGHLKDYTPPVSLCSECGHASFMPFDILYRGLIELRHDFFKDDGVFRLPP